MTGPRTSLRRRALATLVAVGALAAACTGGGSPAASGSTSPPSSSQPSASPTRPTFQLQVQLKGVRAEFPRGRLRPASVRNQTRNVVETIHDLYSIGFVDPSAWHGGEFPGLLTLFAGNARARAEDHLQGLTLGRAANELEAVKPRHTWLRIRFLADAARRPVVAVADVRFAGVGISAEGRRPIHDEGEYTLRRINGRWRIVAYDVKAHVIGQPRDASFLPSFPSTHPMFFLVIGSDARPGQSVTATRGDSLHIVGINPQQGRASVLGISRDSYVPIAGGGTDKINAALARGGPDLLVETVERLSGIHLDGYILTGFAGFKDIVGAVHGIDIRIPFPISDHDAHAHFHRGPEHLDGFKALAFSRARHDLPNGDFGRSANQGLVLIAALATLRDRFLRQGPIALFPWALAAFRYLQTDLSITDVIDLLLAAPSIDPRHVRNDVVTGHVGSVGGLSVVFLDSGATARFRDLGRDGLLGR